jgi:hypothetical protein
MLLLWTEENLWMVGLEIFDPWPWFTKSARKHALNGYLS